MNWHKATPEQIRQKIRDAMAAGRGVNVSPRWLLGILSNAGILPDECEGCGRLAGKSGRLDAETIHRKGGE